MGAEARRSVFRNFRRAGKNCAQFSMRRTSAINDGRIVVDRHTNHPALFLQSQKYGFRTIPMLGTHAVPARERFSLYRLECKLKSN
jgi:hypothetical protein